MNENESDIAKVKRCLFIGEIANFITHAISIPAVVYAFLSLQLNTNSHQFMVMALYGGMMLSLFAVSAFYHLSCLLARMYPDGRWYGYSRNFLRAVDRSMIHLFIAACYTPWLLLRKNVSFFNEEVCKAVWICALLSIIAQNSPFKWRPLQSEAFVVGSYLLLGVLPGTFICAFATDYTGIPALAGGGLLYIAGLVFYFAEDRLLFAHAIWHLFVNLGAFVHYREMNEYIKRTQELERILAEEQAHHNSWIPWFHSWIRGGDTDHF